MELSKALTRALKFIPKGKDQPPLLQCVRLIPRSGSHSAKVMATDGHVTCVINVPGDLPNGLIPAASLGLLAKREVLQIAEAESGKFRITGANGSVTQLKALDYSGFPGIPALPELRWEPEWKEVLRVVHAVAATEERGNEALAYVHFHPDRVEACDLSRAARIDVPLGLTGLVPAAAFKQWPTGGVVVGFTGTHAVFGIGTEFRIAQLRPGGYPPLGRWLDTHHHEYWVADTTVLASLVSQAAQFTKTRTISLDFGWMGIGVGASDTAVELPFGGIVEAKPGSTGGPTRGGSILLNGKLLGEALKQVTTPKVRIHFGGSMAPLQLVSGAWSAVVWPVLPT